MTEGIWIIPNALPDMYARSTADFLDKEMPSGWWFRGVEHAEKLPDTIENWRENKSRVLHAENVAADGGFAYSFRRTVANHHAGCYCRVCETLALFARAPFMRRISKDTGVHVSVLGHSFASWFAANDFLSTHTDKGNGKLAFVWNLTMADWKPQWGGVLHLLSSDWKHIEMSITPTFNTLVLFDVRGEGRPHFVSQVLAGVKEKRLAISGWFS